MKGAKSKVQGAKSALADSRPNNAEPEFDLLAFIAVVAGCERVCAYCGCSDNAGCPEGCSWAVLHPATPTGVCSRCLEIARTYPEIKPKYDVMHETRPARKGRKA